MHLISNNDPTFTAEHFYYGEALVVLNNQHCQIS